MKPRFKFLIAAVAALAAGVLIFVNLGSFPGVRVDEAWFSLEALDMKTHGLFSPYASNWYTSTIHPWLVSKVFSVLAPSAFSLRLPSAAINTVTAFLAVYFAAEFFGAGAAAVMGAFVLSPFYLLFARGGYEVCAFQNFFTVCIIASLFVMARRGKISLFPAAVLAFCCYAGTVSHIIAVAIPLGLSVGFFAYEAETRDKKFAPLAALVFLVFCACSAITLARRLLVPPFFLSSIEMGAKCGFVKPVADGLVFWAHHKAGIILAAFSLPLAAAVIAWKWQENLARLESLAAEKISPKKIARYAVGAGLFAFLWFHSTAFFGVVSGYNVFKYFFSLDIGFFAGLAVSIFAAVLTGQVFTSALSLARKGGGDALKTCAAVSLIGIFAVFPLLTNINTQRYYLIPFMAFAFAAAAFLPEHFRAARLRTKLSAAVCLLIIWGIFVPEVVRPQLRPLLGFKNGWHRTDSRDQLPTVPFYEEMRREKLCVISRDPKISLVSRYYYRLSPYPCSGERNTVWKDYVSSAARQRGIISP